MQPASLDLASVLHELQTKAKAPEHWLVSVRITRRAWKMLVLGEREEVACAVVVCEQPV